MASGIQNSKEIDTWNCFLRKYKQANEGCFYTWSIFRGFVREKLIKTVLRPAKPLLRECNILPS